jgi:hypothetical protein
MQDALTLISNKIFWSIYRQAKAGCREGGGGVAAGKALERERWQMEQNTNQPIKYCIGYSIVIMIDVPAGTVPKPNTPAHYAARDAVPGSSTLKEWLVGSGRC